MSYGDAGDCGRVAATATAQLPRCSISLHTAELTAVGNIQFAIRQVLLYIQSQVLAPQTQGTPQRAAGSGGKPGGKAAPESGVVAVVEAEPTQKGKKKGAKTRRGKKGGAVAAPAAMDVAADVAAPGSGPAAAASLLTGASVARLLQSERGIAAAQDIGIGGAAGGQCPTLKLTSSTASHTSARSEGVGDVPDPALTLCTTPVSHPQFCAPCLPDTLVVATHCCRAGKW